MNESIATFEAETDGIVVSVQSYFLPEQSLPEQNRFVWGYSINIHNTSSVRVQLLTRHWVITDGLGRRTEVEGQGVIGEQPTLAPGQNHSYSSGTPLGTSTGFMSGSYGMQREDGTYFKATVPAFSLDSPHQRSRLN